MTDLLDLLLSNMQVQQFLTSLGTVAAKEAGERVGKWVVGSIASRIKESKLFKENKVMRTEKILQGFIAKRKQEGITLVQNFWIDFLAFMFPEIDVTIDQLDAAKCRYIANRIYTGLGFEQLLLDAGYKLERIRYMTHFQGQRSLVPHYFDLTATFEQEYFDNLLIARVIDLAVSSPHDFVNSLPSVIQDINGDSTTRPASLRDHDIISIVLSTELTTRKLTRLRKTIETVQRTNDVILPRIVLFASRELTDLLAGENPDERGARVMGKFQSVRPYRGIE